MSGTSRLRAENHIPAWPKDRDSLRRTTDSGAGDRCHERVLGARRQLSKAELYQRATDQDIAGRSKMSREQLIDALARAGRSRKKSAA
jgi:DNA end-binding protein Ku